jgi:hypothetical protein
MLGGRGKCMRCQGSGMCQECYGTGKNTHLNTPGELCEACKGSAQCQACGGIQAKDPISKFLLWLRGDR